MATTTKYTIPFLRKNGYFAEQVEKFNSYTKTRHDLFGFIDVLAFKPPSQGVLASATTELDSVDFTHMGCLGIQCCRSDDMATHLTLYIEHTKKRQLLEQWLSCGNRFEVWGWSKKAVRNPDGSFATFKNGNRKPKTMQPTFRRLTFDGTDLWIHDDESEILQNLETAQN